MMNDMMGVVNMVACNSRSYKGSGWGQVSRLGASDGADLEVEDSWNEIRSGSQERMTGEVVDESKKGDML